MDIIFLWHHRGKLKESEKKEKYLKLDRVLKNIEYENDGEASFNWRTRNSHQRMDKGNNVIGNKRVSLNNLYSSVVKIGQNTKKNPGDFRRLVVTQTPVKGHQQIVVRKTLKGVK